MITPAQRQQILALAERNESVRAISRATGLHRETIGRVLRARANTPPAIGTLSAIGTFPATPPGTPPGTEESLEAEVRSLMSELRAESRACSASGDAGNAAKFARIGAMLAPLLARLERARGQEDGVFIPASELAAKRAQLVAHLRTLASGPFLCAKCGREERAAWVDDADDRNPPR